MKKTSCTLRKLRDIQLVLKGGGGIYFSGAAVFTFKTSTWKISVECPGIF